FAAFFFGLLITPVLVSPIEWIIHRFVYHNQSGFLNRIRAVHSAHHHLYFPPSRYVTGGPARRIPITSDRLDIPQGSKLGNAATYGAHFGFYMTLGATLVWLPAWLLSQSMGFLIGTFVA